MTKSLHFTQVAHNNLKSRGSWKCYRVLPSGYYTEPHILFTPSPFILSPEGAARTYASHIDTPPLVDGAGVVRIAVGIADDLAVFFEATFENGLVASVVPLAPEEPEPDDPVTQLRDQVRDQGHQIIELLNGIRVVLGITRWPAAVADSDDNWVPVVLDLLETHCKLLETERTDAQQTVARLACERDRAFQNGILSVRPTDAAAALERQLGLASKLLAGRSETIVAQHKRIAQLEGQIATASTEVGGREEFLRQMAAVLPETEAENERLLGQLDRDARMYSDWIDHVESAIQRLYLQVVPGDSPGVDTSPRRLSAIKAAWECLHRENERLREAMPDPAVLRKLAAYTVVAGGESVWTDRLREWANTIEAALKPEKEPNHGRKIGPFAC